MTPAKKPKEKLVGTRLPIPQYRQLKALAKENERSIGAEIRLLIHERLKQAA